uniref:Uncharacterized protein n=1 Tax=Meloidogyne javanica TaxID=6303 RepID=A0A915N286_MELJA
MFRNWFGFSHFPSLQNSSIRYHSSSGGYVSFTCKGTEGDLFDWIRRPKIICEENDKNYFIRRRVDYGIEKEIERMKSSARVIAESLGDFGKCLRETELPNDVQTTEKVLEMQQHERDAIKEDFRISIRKGLQLLRQVRQTEESSIIDHQHPSPCSLQNIAAIERMIAQLQDTEKSFDTFWQKHRLRLMSCLELRRFEDEFRKVKKNEGIFK